MTYLPVSPLPLWEAGKRPIAISPGVVSSKNLQKVPIPETRQGLKPVVNENTASLQRFVGVLSCRKHLRTEFEVTEKKGQFPEMSF